MAEYITVIAVTIAIIGVVFGVLYPLAAIMWYKLCGSKKSIAEILKRI